MEYNAVIKRSQNVRARVLTAAQGKRFNFENINNLSGNNIWLYGIQAYSAAELSQTPQGDTIIPAAGVTGVTVTLVNNEKKEVHYQVPLVDLIKQTNAGLVYVIDPLQLNLTNCYIELANPAGITADEVVYFKLIYFIKDANGQLV